MVGPSCSRFDTQFFKQYSSEKIVNAAEVNQWHCLEESGHWPEKIYETQLVPASAS